MDKLILVRHGEYDHVDGQYLLNDKGLQQMLILAPKLKQLVGSTRAAVHTSSAPRATASAAPLADALGVRAEEHRELWSGNDGIGCNPDMRATLLLINEWGASCDVLVVVTHMEIVDRLPDIFVSHVFESWAPSVRINKGQAGVLDCATQTIYLLS
jgi:phosphohistidine phosphatase SixA